MTSTLSCFKGWSYTETGHIIKATGEYCSSRASPESGYRYVRHEGQLYRQHRVIFFLHYGYWPNEIDHINRVRHDNRIENLRDVTHSENNQNKVVRKDSRSGIKGVSYTPKDNKIKPWRADFRCKPLRKTKRFKTKEEALAKRKEWERRYT